VGPILWMNGDDRSYGNAGFGSDGECRKVSCRVLR
jgi:hypothetical protein